MAMQYDEPVGPVQPAEIALRQHLLDRNTIMVISAIAIVVIALIKCSSDSFLAASCDMTIAENRDFNKYYGISGLKNHFTTPAADECNSNIIFRPILPQAVLNPDNSASSFLTLAQYGTGKTLLRCEYSNSLSSKTYLKVIILNEQINEYLNRYVSQSRNSQKDCEKENCLQNWSENEFAQLLLSTLITEFVSKYHNEQMKFPLLSLDEKIDLITIICYYYNGIGTSELENFINSFLGKKFPSMYRADRSATQIEERNLFVDKPLLIHLKADFNKFSILKRDYERLHLLLSVLEGEQFQNQAIRKTLYGNVFYDLTRFSSFIKNNLLKSIVFIIDGIDENRYFFQKNEVNKIHLELFCRSSVSQEIISKVMGNFFFLSIFYPQIPGINIQEFIIRKDKFPTHSIEWSIKSMLNYADYVLQQMNHKANNTRCQAFTNFNTLVNYSDKKIAEIIQKILTPRALHFFMTALIREMNNDANHVKSPFIATFENVHSAYQQSFENFHKYYKIKE